MAGIAPLQHAADSLEPTLALVVTTLHSTESVALIVPAQRNWQILSNHPIQRPKACRHLENHHLTGDPCRQHEVP